MRKPIKHGKKFDEKYLSKKEWNDLEKREARGYNPGREEVGTAMDLFFKNGGEITECRIEDTVGYVVPPFSASYAYEENN